MSLTGNIRSGVRWVFVGKVGQQVLNFVIGVVLARLLLPAHFGLLVTIQVFTGLAGFVSGGGMGQALIRASEMTLRDSHVVFTAQLFLGVLIYSFFFSLAPWFADWFEEPLYKDLLRVSALTFLFRPFSNTASSLLHRNMRFKAISFIQITVLLVTGTTSITMAVLGFEVWSLVLSGLLGSALNVFFSGIATRWLPRFAFDRQVLRRLGGYGLKVSAVNIVLYLKKNTGNFVISRFLGPAAVGFFNKGATQAELPHSLITGSANGVVFRALSKMQEDLDTSKYTYLRSLTLATAYSYPFFVGLWWVAEPFIYTIYGPKWIESGQILRILVFTGFFLTIGSLSGAVGAARNLLGRELVVQLFTWALLVASVSYAYQWGIEGVAWAMVADAVVMSSLMARIACRELRVKPWELLLAIRTALLLNGILMAILALAHISVLSGYKASQPAFYLAAMTTLGAAVYGLCFLYLPVPQLATEAHRWKKKMGLAGG